MSDFQFFQPDWPAPDNVGALVTTRSGGVSPAPWNELNLGINTGDDADRVAENQARLRRYLGDLPIQWLRQVHGAGLVDALSGAADTDYPRADACYSDQPGRVCAVLTADCLPVLFCANDGSEVAAAHAGWRGLAAGVLPATLKRFRSPAHQIQAWLGPAISAANYEVGEDVRAAFQRAESFAGVAVDEAFQPGRPGKWQADIYLLAQRQLERLAVGAVQGGGFCTYAETERFYSYRRDGETGRFATLIWRKN